MLNARCWMLDIQLTKRLVIGHWSLAVAAVLFASSSNLLAADMVIPRIENPPKIDGKLSEACWKKAALLDNFSKPSSKDKPVQLTEALLCCTEDTLYIAVTCAEDDPSAIVANRTVENDDIWQDDCIEIWIQDAYDSTQYDQFIVNSLSVRQTYHKRKDSSWEKRKAGWTVKSAVLKDRWVTEIAIPFAETARDKAPGDGEFLRLKIGREDYTGKDATYAAWPPNEMYGRRGNYGVLFVGQEGAAGSTVRAVVSGDPIAVPTDGTITLITHIPVADCRILRGFCWAPVDGSIDSRDWAGKYWEYNMPGTGTGVQYDFKANDGLHITLADQVGVDSIQLRGGVAADLYTDCPKYDEPAGGNQVAVLRGRADNTYKIFDRRVESDKFSFFNVRDGVIGDVSFFRVEHGSQGFHRNVKSNSPSKPGAAGALLPHIEQRFPGSTNRLFGFMAPGGQVITRMNFKAGEATHFISPAYSHERDCRAVGFKGTIAERSTPVRMTIQFQDPVHPWSAVSTADIAIDGAGKFHAVIDCPDVFLDPGKQFWLTIVPHDDFSMTVPRVERYFLRAKDRPEAIETAFNYQFRKLKGLFSVMSEARPWNVVYRHKDLPTWFEKYAHYETYLRSMMTGIDHCRYLAPENHLAKQYDDWFYRKINEKAREFKLPAAVLPVNGDVPVWALAARTAWLELREVPEWWLDNRNVPTGEFGTEVNDDSCLYQNFANFPMHETGGVAGRIKDAAARFWDLTIEGGYLDQGINAHQEDPLHAYEEGINHESMMTWWNYGDPVYFEQCMLAAKSVEKLTTVNAAGHRHFVGMTVSSADLLSPRAPGIDGYNHAQLMHPVLEVARYNKNPAAMRLLTDYADAWLAHSQGPDKYATRVNTLTDEVLDTSYVPFQEGMTCQFSVMLTAAEVTGDRRYVQPMLDVIQSIGYRPRGYVEDLYSLGYLDGMTNSVLENLCSVSSALRLWHGGKTDPIITDLKTCAAEIQHFRHIYTSAEFFADRIFLEHFRKLTMPSIAFTGGYATRNKPYHSHSASWQGFGTNYAALVRQSRTDSFSATVYSFSPDPMKGSLQLWKLMHGEYDVKIGIDINNDGKPDQVLADSVRVIARGSKLPLSLPSHRTLTVEITLRKKRLDITDRPDLALSPREIRIEGETVYGVAHNIGARGAGGTMIALVNARGVVQKKYSLGHLRAPLDLEPQRIDFQVSGLPEDHKGWSVALDPEDKIEEITELNNSVALSP